MFQIFYNRTTNHIDGLAIRTEGSDFNYSLSHCPALSRNASRMGRGDKSEDLAKILRWARIDRKLCKSCEAAAQAQLNA